MSAPSRLSVLNGCDLATELLGDGDRLQQRRLGRRRIVITDDNAREGTSQTQRQNSSRR